MAGKLARHGEMVHARRQLHRALAPIEDMHRRYELKPYPGRLTLMLASDSYLARDPRRDPRRRWQNLGLGGVEILTVAGDHESLLRPPFVADLSRKLAPLLQGGHCAPSTEETGVGIPARQAGPH